MTYNSVTLPYRLGIGVLAAMLVFTIQVASAEIAPELPGNNISDLSVTLEVKDAALRGLGVAAGDLDSTTMEKLSLQTWKRKSRTAADRWQKFEQEFGIKENHPSPVLDAVQSGKYLLDKAVFAGKDFVELMRFEYDLDQVGKALESVPLMDEMFSDGKLKVGIDENAFRKGGLGKNRGTGGSNQRSAAGPLVSIRLEFPIGN